MVPKWVRGNESAEIVEPTRQPMVMLGLGDSVGTPGRAQPASCRREVLVVHSFEELESKAAAARGPHRLLQRAVHELRRDRAVPLRRRRREPRATAPSPC